jgi:hypothetical protein
MMRRAAGNWAGWRRGNRVLGASDGNAVYFRSAHARQDSLEAVKEWRLRYAIRDMHIGERAPKRLESLDLDTVTLSGARKLNILDLHLPRRFF